MISAIRNSMGSKGFKIVLWIALFAIPGGTLIVGIMNRFGSKATQRVASVNGIPIPVIEFRRNLQNLEQQVQEIKARFGEHAQLFLQMLGLREGVKMEDVVLDRLVQERLLFDAAKKSGIVQNDASFLAEKMADPLFAQKYLSDIMPAYLFNAVGEFDGKTFGRFLSRQGLSYQDFIDAVNARVNQALILDLIQNAAYTPKRVAGQGRRSFSILSLDFDSYIKNARKAGVPERELKKYFDEQNKAAKRYWRPEVRSYTMWTFSPDGYKLTVSDKDIRTFYGRNRAQYADKKLKDVRDDIEKKIRAQKFKQRFSLDARRILEQLKKNPDAVSDFAKKRKAKKQARSNEAKIPGMKLSEKIFSVTKVGKGGILPSETEGILFVVNEIRPAYQPALKDVQSEVETDYFGEQAEKTFAKDLQQMRVDLAKADSSELAKKWNARRRTHSLGVGDEKGWSLLQKDGAPVGRMKKMIHEGAVIEHRSPERGFVILLDEYVPESELDGAIKDGEKARLHDHEKQLFAQALIASLQNNATIKYEDLSKIRK